MLCLKKRYFVLSQKYNICMELINIYGQSNLFKLRKTPHVLGLINFQLKSLSIYIHMDMYMRSQITILPIQ